MCNEEKKVTEKKELSIREKMKPAVTTCACIAGFVAYFWACVKLDAWSTKRTYQKGFGYTKKEAEFVYDKLNKLKPERALKVGKKIGRCVLWILRMES